MGRIESPWSQPDLTLARAEEADREIRISDFALMALLPVRSVAVAGFPFNELAIVVLLGLCLFRPARGQARLPGPVVLMLAALMALLVYSGQTNDVDWLRRVGHLGIMSGLIWAGGTGRLSLRSAGAGLATGLIVVIALALAGIGGSSYPGRLTGFLADPNAGAYFIAVLGCLAIFFCDSRTKVRLVVAIPVLTGLVLSYSRTGLLAGALAILWLVVGRRLSVMGGAAVAGLGIWAVNRIPESLTTVGPFSDRSGSDALRNRIIAQERVELAGAPWFGNGPGTASVEVREQTFFFHNSYLATRQEGGWLALLLILGLLFFTFMLLSRQAREGDIRAAACQAAIVATAVMAITLGEVLLDTPTAVVIAVSLGHTLHVVRPDPPDG